MTVADTLLTPEIATPRGLPPKKLIVSIFGGLAVAAIGLSLFSQDHAEQTTADGRARDAVSKLNDVDRSTLGASVSTVAESAARAGLPADFAGGQSVRNPASEAPAATGAQRPVPTEVNANPGAPLPKDLQTKPSHQSGEQGGLVDKDPAVIARQVEAINSNIIVFDDGAVPKAPVTNHTRDIERQIEQLAVTPTGSPVASGGTVGSGPTGADIARQIAEAQNPRPVRPRQMDSQFVQEFAQERSRPGIRPVSLESQRAVLEGTVIPAVLTRSIVTDLPGVVTAVVNRDVYDTLSATQRLICKGSRLIGRYSNEVQAGQSRMLFAFSRLILPDGSSFDLAGFNGSDQSGAAGVEGDVNTHFWKVFGASLAIGVLADRLTVASATPQGQMAQRSATGQIMVDTSTDYLSRVRSIQPTITIPQGTQINVEVRRDMLFPAGHSRSCT